MKLKEYFLKMFSSYQIVFEVLQNQTICKFSYDHNRGLNMNTNIVQNLEQRKEILTTGYEGIVLPVTRALIVQSFALIV